METSVETLTETVVDSAPELLQILDTLKATNTLLFIALVIALGLLVYQLLWRFIKYFI